MAEIITFENKSLRQIEIIIEPSAEYIDLPAGKAASFEISESANDFNDAFEMVHSEGTIVVYEQRGRSLQVFIAGELKFTNR